VKSVNGVAYVAAGGKNVHNNDMGFMCVPCLYCTEIEYRSPP